MSQPGVTAPTVTPETVLRTGELLVSAAAAAGVAATVRFLHARGRPRAVQLITNDWMTFASYAVPYLINFLVCWHLSLTFGRLAAANQMIADAASRHYVASKTALNLVAVVTKNYLFYARSRMLRLGLFVGHLVLVAVSEALCHEKYTRTSVDTTLVLLCWLTVIVLIAPATAYQNLVFTETFTWRRFSLVYALVTGVCYNWLRSDGKNTTFDAVLLVLVVHVQFVFLCVTYFSDAQQVLRNVAGLGPYNPMADSLDIYFTMDSIMSRMNAMKSLHGNITWPSDKH